LQLQFFSYFGLTATPVGFIVYICDLPLDATLVGGGGTQALLQQNFGKFKGESSQLILTFASDAYAVH
jgi:hypothetical protein